jgi:hypothetical protein
VRAEGGAGQAVQASRATAALRPFGTRVERRGALSRRQIQEGTDIAERVSQCHDYAAMQDATDSAQLLAHLERSADIVLVCAGQLQAE